MRGKKRVSSVAECRRAVIAYLVDDALKADVVEGFQFRDGFNDLHCLSFNVQSVHQLSKPPVAGAGLARWL